MSDYWDTYWRRRRASRRVFLAGAGTATAGAAGLALVGCGGDDDDDDDGDGGGLATATPVPEATQTPTPEVKLGGTYNIDATGDPPSIDPYGNLSFLTKGAAAYTYSRLFRYNTAAGKPTSELQAVPDIVEDVETTPDGLTHTMKLRADVLHHDIAPVNGRAVDTEDVAYSWGRATEETNTNRTQLAFVDKVEYPDASTIVFTLKSPNAAFFDVLADANLLWIVPKEADGGFNSSTTMIGSGPWILDEYSPGVGFKFLKNPAWHETGYPLMDGIDLAIIPEYTNRLAQFLAGATDTTGLVADDLISVKEELPDLQLYGEVAQLLSFMFMDPNPDSPWRKDEVRQAMSMALDRDAITDLGYNVNALRDAGLEVLDPWNNIIPAGMTRFWLDPKGSDIGEGGKNFEYNVEEARALMSAAGYPDGFDTKYQYVAARYGATFDTIAETNIQFLAEIGINCQTEVQDYSSVYITQTFAGNFTGIAFGYETPFPEAGSYPLRQFTENALNHGKINDQTLADLAVQQQQELDFEARRELFYEIQRYHATKMYYIPNQAGAGTTWVGNQGHLRGVDIQTIGYPVATETYPYRWKDV